MKAILDKIRGLRKLSASTNPHEAAAAAALADALIQRHRIEETELEVTTGEAVEPTEDPMPVEQWFGRRAQRWQAVLAHELCRHYDVASYNHRIGKNTYAMGIGRPSDVALAREMQGYLREEIMMLSRAMRGRGRSALLSFRMGYVAGVIRAMRAAKAGVVEQSSVALVLASRYEQSEAALARLHPKLRNARPGRDPSDIDAFFKGVQAGQSIDTAPKPKRLPGVKAP